MTTAAIAAARHPLTFKIATEPAELEQVHRLNYRTFVEEIPQHRANAERALVDRFHDDNTYFIARRGPRVVGMIAVRDRRPFSLDEKLPDLDAYLPHGLKICEVRLLAVDREFRNGIVFRGMIAQLSRYGVSRGFNAAVISGAVRQQRLYAHMGFVPFGPRVGSVDAPYQPMYVTLDAFRANAGPSIVRADRKGPVPTLSFMPGPVDLHPAVKAALAAPAISHRDEAFISDLRQTRRMLRRLTNAPRVEILVGSGTLANDVVATQLGALRGRGLVLSNGEFGERLVDHATRANLRFDCERLDWGVPWDAESIDRALDARRDARWLWIVHHETSTGVLNHLARATFVCNARGIRLAADCVSSIGLVPVDLCGVHLASGVSGKAIGSLAGLALVFHQGNAAATPRAPRYLDFSLYAEAEGVPFTLPSPMLGALRAACELALARDHRGLGDVARWMRQELRDMGLRPLAPDHCAAPGLETIALPETESSVEWGDALARAGFALNYRSDYLRQRNWIQIALMGECSREKVERLLLAIRSRLSALGSRPT